MADTTRPTLAELGESVHAVCAELETIFLTAQPLLHRHRELLQKYVEVSEELFVDVCERDGYLAFAEALGRLTRLAQELDARAFIGRNTSSGDLLNRPLISAQFHLSLAT